MSDPDLIAAQRESATELAQELERSYLDETRDIAVRELYRKVKLGLKSRALLDSKLGEAFVLRCAELIVFASDTWLTTNDAEKIAAAKVEAQGAIMAIRIFDDILVSTPDAERQLRTIEQELGE